MTMRPSKLRRLRALERRAKPDAERTPERVEDTGFVPPFALPPKPAPAAIGGFLSNTLFTAANTCSVVEPLSLKSYAPVRLKRLYAGTSLLLIVTSGKGAVA